MQLPDRERGWPIRRRPRLLSLLLSFLGLSMKRCPGRSVLNRLCSPHLFPQSPKARAGRGGGGAGRIVTQMLFWPGGPYCHANVCWLCPFLKGEMLSVFKLLFFCVWFGVPCRFCVLLVLGSLFEKIFGGELLFLGVVVGLVLFDRVLPRFLFYILVFRSRKCPEKTLFTSGLLFFLRVCSLAPRKSPDPKRGPKIHLLKFLVLETMSQPWCPNNTSVLVGVFAGFCTPTSAQ